MTAYLVKVGEDISSPCSRLPASCKSHQVVSIIVPFTWWPLLRGHTRFLPRSGPYHFPLLTGEDVTSMLSYPDFRLRGKSLLAWCRQISPELALHTPVVSLTPSIGFLPEILRCQLSAHSEENAPRGIVSVFKSTSWF